MNGLARLIGAAILAALPLLAHADDRVARGEYLMRAADCQPCHTKPGGTPFAGGLLIGTPFGSLSTPNITPDPDTGIGRWTDQQFYEAVHDGIGKNGEDLVPGDAVHLLHQDAARGRAGDLRLSEDVEAGLRAARAQPHGISLQRPLRHDRVARAVLPPRRVRSRPEGIRRLEPRRLSGARPRPLRRVPLATQHPGCDADRRQPVGRSGRALAGPQHLFGPEMGHRRLDDPADRDLPEDRRHQVEGRGLRPDGRHRARQPAIPDRRRHHGDRNLPERRGQPH